MFKLSGSGGGVRVAAECLQQSSTNGPIRLAFQPRHQPRHLLPLCPALHSHTHAPEGELNPN